MDSIQVSLCHPVSLHYAVICRYVVTAPAQNVNQIGER
jgi:hypothetical protein